MSAGSAGPAIDANWRSAFLVGAIAAVLALSGTLFDLVLASLPAWGVSTVPDSPGLWMLQFQENPLLGLRNLDLLNIIVAVVGLPMYVALFGAHRKTRAGLSMLALVLVGVGTAIFVANNVALPMLELSREYGLASSDSQRLLIESAASALTARGAHGSMGVFAGFLLPSLGTLVMSVAMLRGGVFSRLVAYAGIVGISLLLAYVVGTTFALGSEGVLMAVAAPGGLLMIVWNAMVARRLLQLRAGV